MVSRYNKLLVRDVLAESCRRAHLVEMGSNVTPNHSRTRPADLLVPNLVLGKPVAFDLSVTSPLNPPIILEESVTAQERLLVPLSKGNTVQMMPNVTNCLWSVYH